MYDTAGFIRVFGIMMGNDNAVELCGNMPTMADVSESSDATTDHEIVYQNRPLFP